MGTWVEVGPGRSVFRREADWPRADGQPIGACLVTYELVKGVRS